MGVKSGLMQITWKNYMSPALVPGYKVVLPWQQKNSITHWNAAVVDPSTVSKYTTKLPSIIVVMKIVYCRQTKRCNIREETREKT